MESIMHNPCSYRSNPKKRRIKSKKLKRYMALVKKHGVTEASRLWRGKGRHKAAKAARKGASMARKGRHLSAAHRRAISRGLRRASDGRRKPLSARHKSKISRSLRRAADGRRHPLSAPHRASISRSLRRSADGRRHPLAPAHRSKIARGVKRAWRSGAYRGSRLGRRGTRRGGYPLASRPLAAMSYGTYKRQPIGDVLGDYLNQDILMEAATYAVGYTVVSFGESYVVDIIQMVREKMGPVTPLPAWSLIPVDLGISVALGALVDAATGDSELASRLAVGGMVNALIKVVNYIKTTAGIRERTPAVSGLGVFSPEETTLNADDYDFEVEGLGTYEPERVELGIGPIREYETPRLGDGSMSRRGGIERFKPYFAG